MSWIDHSCEGSRSTSLVVALIGKWDGAQGMRMEPWLLLWRQNRNLEFLYPSPLNLTTPLPFHFHSLSLPFRFPSTFLPFHFPFLPPLAILILNTHPHTFKHPHTFHNRRYSFFFLPGFLWDLGLGVKG